MNKYRVENAYGDSLYGTDSEDEALEAAAEIYERIIDGTQAYDEIAPLRVFRLESIAEFYTPF